SDFGRGGRSRRQHRSCPTSSRGRRCWASTTTPANASCRSTASCRSSESMKPRILIVEDEPGIADTLQYALRTDGFEPAWAATGEEAMVQMRAQPPALVILDVGLPDQNGFELIKRLREIADVPVVFLTARSDEIDRV